MDEKDGGRIAAGMIGGVLLGAIIGNMAIGLIIGIAFGFGLFKLGRRNP